MYDDFETGVVLQDYFRDRLEEENLDYAAVISEYRDGLLIFDVMEKNIWSACKNRYPSPARLSTRKTKLAIYGRIE